MLSAAFPPPYRTSVMTGHPAVESPTAIPVPWEVGAASQVEPAGMASTSMRPACTLNGTVACA